MYIMCNISKKRIFLIIMLGLHIYFVWVLVRYIVGAERIKTDWRYYVQFVAQQYETQSSKSGHEKMALYSVYFETTDSIYKSWDSGLKKENMDQYMSALKAKVLQKSNMDDLNAVRYSFCTCVDDFVNNSSTEIPVELVVYGGSFCSFHMGNMMGDDTYVDRNAVLINNELSFLLFGSETSEGMPLKLHENYYYVSGIVNDGRPNNVLYIPWDTFDEYIGKTEGVELSITCVEILMPEQYEGEGEEFVCDVFNIKQESDSFSNEDVNEGKVSFVRNTGRFSFSQILKHTLSYKNRGSKMMSSKIEYPFWEIAAVSFIERQVVNLFKLMITVMLILNNWCIYNLKKDSYYNN